jgi:hypothetical protein
MFTQKSGSYFFLQVCLLLCLETNTMHKLQREMMVDIKKMSKFTIIYDLATTYLFYFLSVTS